MYKLTLFIIISFELFLYAQEKIYNYDETIKPNKFELNELVQNDEILFNTNTYNQSGSWSKDLSIPGIVGLIYVSATDGSNLYLGGQFKSAGTTIANNIVKWNGQRWTSIGVGTENGTNIRNSGDVPAVHAIAYGNGKLFVGGQFTKAGSKEVNGIAYWNGSGWNSLGSDTENGVRRILVIAGDTIIAPGFVWSLFIHKNKIYIGGDFQLAGDKKTNGIAAWDMNTHEWESFDGGLASIYENDPVYIYCFAANGDDIYMGGKFYLAGGVPAQNIVRWNGSAFSKIGDAEGRIFDLQFDGENKLYAVGFYNPHQSDGACGVGIWDGLNWMSLYGPQGYTSTVNKLLFYNNELYISGYIENAQTLPGHTFAKWDRNNWMIIPELRYASNEYIAGSARTMQIVNDKLYLAGNFTKANDLFVVNVVEWDMIKSQWIKLDDENKNLGIYDGYIVALERNDETIYAGGSFTIAGGVFARSIAKWVAGKWESIGNDYENGIRGTVYTILADGDDLYVGGYFGSAGSTEAYHVAKWDGSHWSSIGIGVGGVPGAHVNALAKSGDYLYVAGYFSIVGDEETYTQPANSIARFNLVTKRWETLGRGIEYVYGIPGKVYDLELDGNKIYVGGNFQSADDKFYLNFAVLTNNKWSGIGDNHDIGIEGNVGVVKVINDEIYIGGIVKLERDGESYGILKWGDKGWTTVGQKLTADKGQVFLYDIESFGEGFLIGGYFKYAGNKKVNNIAYFNGSEWYNLDAGILPGVTEISVLNNDVFICGPDIIISDETVSYGIGKYNSNITSIQKDEISNIEFRLHQNFPNPFNPTTKISFVIPKSSEITLKLYDALGREVSTLIDDYREAGAYSFYFEASHLASGIYFYRLITDTHAETKKMVLLR